MKAHFDGPPPAGPQPIEDIYREYVEYVLPYQLGNSHPRFWGWVLGSGTPMGVLAEMLAAATDSVSGIYSYVSNNYVELQVLDWCKEMLGYPLSAGGLLTSGCSASNLIALAVARNAGAGFDVRGPGVQALPERLTFYARRRRIVAYQGGRAPRHWARTRCDACPTDDLSHRPRGPRRRWSRRSRRRAAPLCAVGVAGTTNTGSIDDLAGPRRLLRARRPLVPRGRRLRRLGGHLSRFRHLVAGMERADSLALDLHKWMHLPTRRLRAGP